jgi:hypothetical protein
MSCYLAWATTGKWVDALATPLPTPLPTPTVDKVDQSVNSVINSIAPLLQPQVAFSCKPLLNPGFLGLPLPAVVTADGSYLATCENACAVHLLQLPSRVRVRVFTL